MAQPLIECKACGKTVTPEEVMAGESLICPRCEEEAGEGVREDPGAERPGEVKPEDR